MYQLRQNKLNSKIWWFIIFLGTFEKFFFMFMFKYSSSLDELALNIFGWYISCTMDTISVVFLLIIIVSCIVFNVFALTFIYRLKNRRVTKEKIIAFLCIINLSQVSGYSIQLHGAVTEHLPDAACKTGAFIICFTTYTSIGLFVTLIVERYIAIIHPYKYHVWADSREFIVLCILLPIIYGFVFAVFPFTGWGRYGRSKNRSFYCSFEFSAINNNDTSFFFTVVVFCFVLPLMLTSICFGHIFLELRKMATKVRLEYGKTANISIDSAKRVHEQYVSSVLTAMLYLVSWLPYTICCFLFYYQKEVPKTLEYVSVYVSKSSTVTSPIVFYLIEKKVRRFIKKEAKDTDMLPGDRSIVAL